MDFVVGLPMTSQRHDCLIVVVNKLTKSAHFILTKINFGTVTMKNEMDDPLVGNVKTTRAHRPLPILHVLWWCHSAQP